MKHHYKTILTLLFVAFAFATTRATTLEFDKIKYWVGEGDSKAAFVVYFNGTNKAQVWGYRWNKDEVTPSGADMAKAIASGSDDFAVMIQWTNFGYTFSGAGYSPKHNSIMSYIHYDFEGATEDANISFGYYTPNSGMGQTVAPGASTPDICGEAIQEAITTHIIEHPLNHNTCGYSAYDYDHWQLVEGAPKDILWRAGWYIGYWSYWVGDTNLSEFGYSGLGMSSVELVDGAVNGWAYYILSGDDYGMTSVDWDIVELDYDHLDTDGVETITANEIYDDLTKVYSLSGMYLGTFNKIRDKLNRGIYILRTTNGSTAKICL